MADLPAADENDYQTRSRRRITRSVGEGEANARQHVAAGAGRYSRLLTDYRTDYTADDSAMTFALRDACYQQERARIAYAVARAAAAAVIDSPTPRLTTPEESNQ